jgi:hypothetical protein
MQVIFVNLDHGNISTAQSDWKLDKDMIIVGFEDCTFSLDQLSYLVSQMTVQLLRTTLTSTSKSACRWAAIRSLSRS